MKISHTIAAVVGLMTMTGAAIADVTASSSTDPFVSIGQQMKSLMGSERAGLRSVPTSRLQALTAPLRGQPRQGGASYSEAWLASQPAGRGGAEWQCLTEALYFEARGESLEGQIAVSEVILNRVGHSGYPGTICGVVNQGTGERNACQFSYTCDGKPEVVSEPATWDRMGRIARAMLDGKATRSLTHGATHYHATSVSPHWASQYERTAHIGEHLFYRQYYPGRSASN